VGGLDPPKKGLGHDFAEKSAAARHLARQARTERRFRRQIIPGCRASGFCRTRLRAATVARRHPATPLASGTFYNYFKIKEEVYQAIRDRGRVAIRPRLHEERMKAATVEEFITCTFRTFFEFVAATGVNFPHHPSLRRHHARGAMTRRR